jgi:type II secretory pathway predicted ATPase ExeA
MTDTQNASGNHHASNLPPFPAFPSASRYVPIGSVDEAMVRVGRSIDANEAISLVMGPPGTGKSLVCQTLTRRYESSHDVVVLGNASIEDRDSLLRHILHRLGADHIAGPTNDLQLSLVDRVCGEGASQGGLLIIVDEAQSIPREVMEAIRMTTNIMQDGKPRVSAILCGGPKLDEVLVDPSMEAFTQRVATRCYLHPFSADETREYITSVIAQCDADPDRTITLEAISAVHHGCSGVPRLINQLMTQSIDVAEELGQSMIDETVVDRAWAMLQQLPSPMVDQPKLKATRDGAEPTVEFGELSDWDSDEDKLPSQSAEPDDIMVATPSATWMDDEQEPAAADEDDDQTTNPELSEQIENTVPPAIDLFGEFDDEEEVPVGSPVNTASPAEPSSGKSEPVAAHEDLESMLHQEIVGLTTHDDTAVVFAEHADCEMYSFASDSAVGNAEPQDDIVLNDRCDSQSWIEQEAESTELQIDDKFEEDSFEEDCFQEDREEDFNGPALRFVEEADADLDSDPFEIRLAHDDRDLLVIEDELDLQGEQKSPLSDEDRENEPAPITVDYQELMSRMRTGT